MIKLWKQWQRFWFGSTELLGLSLFRFLFSVVLFFMYLFRFFEFEVFFSNKGLLSITDLNTYVMDYIKPQWYLFSASDVVNKVFYVILLLLILTLVFGIANRAMTFLTFLLHLLFIQRNPAIVYGADLVSTFWLFYLSFVNHNQFFTIRQWLPFYNKINLKGDIFSSLGFRFIQIQLCIIYAYTGMEKLKGQTWWDGSAVWYVMGNDNIVPFDFSFFQYLPWAVAVMTFSTLLFEIYFPMAIWMKPLRPIWLFLGLCLHGLAMFFMGLTYFSPIMLSSYVLFLNPVVLSNFLANLRLPKQVLKFIGNNQ
ncbi:MAG: hypothetical protein KDD58_06530 [Bdellovibrionales bacterium]|nr:hypothetical protein [Bdellovibrionales bacterium]